MADLLLRESNDGGDLVLSGNDLKLIEGFENMPYIGLFGGNVGFSTPKNRPTNEEAFDWWGNFLLLPNDPAAQFNSLLEQLLNDVALNSSGRVRIEQTVVKDLEFMNAFSTVSATASIVGINKLEILIKIIEPDNLEGNEFKYIWDNTNNELTVE